MFKFTGSTVRLVRAWGGRVSGRDPKMPIGAVAIPDFPGFANPRDAQAAKTHHLLGIIHIVGKSSLAAF